MQDISFVPYPPLEKLGLIGDRRTAALVAADGTLCWMCLPNYDGQSIFAGLLDAANGGNWKLGARGRRFGRQRYLSYGPLLQTTWEDRDYSLDLLDFMPWPQDRREASDINFWTLCILKEHRQTAGARRELIRNGISALLDPTYPSMTK
jgi:GH15 family glucan-1,4-alpha-glucosidase